MPPPTTCSWHSTMRRPPAFIQFPSARIVEQRPLHAIQARGWLPRLESNVLVLALSRLRRFLTRSDTLQRPVSFTARTRHTTCASNPSTPPNRPRALTSSPAPCSERWAMLPEPTARARDSGKWTTTSTTGSYKTHAALLAYGRGHLPLTKKEYSTSCVPNRVRVLTVRPPFRYISASYSRARTCTYARTSTISI
ncbi:hypothetical protein EXIGLDRAFT_153580 [Exidia glandulosa HHB12029]|uniref:Uncharacterized protein n=1 Tax=Exidia glandulosa HHB12029 TaxID=1314781 RepID=A0A165QGQ1_EXIGL|nr:hypothetical protein EXIGLDRAFT_153580 [Exidia glandulosa HHB12029]